MLDKTATPQGPHTPHLPNADTLDPAKSCYVKLDRLPWTPTPYPGIDIKVLLKDETTGLMTALFRWQPGARLPMHEHVDLEQTYVLEGSLVDEEGEAEAGDYVWRPRRHRHWATAPNGALVLSMFLKPNVFMDEAAGAQP